MEDIMEKSQPSQSVETTLRQYLDAIDAVLATTINPTMRLELCDYRRTVDMALRATINEGCAYSDTVIRLQQRVALGTWELYAQKCNLKTPSSPST